MSVTVYDVLETAFHELLEAYQNKPPISLPPDTLAPMFDDFEDGHSRPGQMLYAHGSIISIHNVSWAIGLGMKHCPDQDDRVLADIAAIRIDLPRSSSGDDPYIAPPPRDPCRILHETLVTNEEFESSLLVACRDGSLVIPHGSLLHGTMSHVLLPHHLASCIANDTRGAHEPIRYVASFASLLGALLGAALSIASAEARAGLPII